MPTNIEDLEVDEPPSVEPYEVLGVEKTATQDQIKTAYRKTALKWHPDKVKAEDKDVAHSKFQEIALAYAVLSDPRRRARFDSTGRTDESLDIDDDIFNWSEFYRAQFADVVTADSITQFTEDYKKSDEEREALLAAYTKAKGNMSKVYQLVMVSDPAVDDERFRVIINEAIENDEVESFDAFTKESQKSIDRRIEKAKKEGKQAEEHAKKIGVHDKLFGGKAKGNADSSESSLAAMIQQRQKSRHNDFFADLEAKYAPKSKGKKRAATPPDFELPEVPEEAFEEMGKRKTKRTKKA